MMQFLVGFTLGNVVGMYLHKTMSDRQITCPKCDKQFLKTDHLKKHLNSHDGKRDFICEKCNKGFLTKYHLTRHLKICKGPKTGRGAAHEEEGEEEDERTGKQTKNRKEIKEHQMREKSVTLAWWGFPQIRLCNLSL